MVTAEAAAQALQEFLDAGFTTVRDVGGIERWDDWCSAWSARAAIHEGLARDALKNGYGFSAGEHYTRAAVCYHFAKFVFVRDMEQMSAAHRAAVWCLDAALPHCRSAQRLRARLRSAETFARALRADAEAAD